MAERTCIMCRERAPKERLFRVVRTPDRMMMFDASGNAAGRGAYVCSSACFEKALSRNRFATALRMKVDAEVLKRVGYELACAEGATVRGGKER